MRSWLSCDQYGYSEQDHGVSCPEYAYAMQQAIFDRRVKLTARRHWQQATDYAYWMGMAIGMLAGAGLGVVVGLAW